MINIGIIGGAGYTGGELIRILVKHPHVSIGFVHSNSNAGNHVRKVHGDLIGETDLHFSGNEVLAANSLNGIEVLFLCTGHGEARKFLEATAIPAHIKIIDLSNDFRLAANAVFQQQATGGYAAERRFVYGLPELNRNEIKIAHNIANPGCFATAIQLGLLPLAKHGFVKDVYTTGITGSTGAGQGLSSTSHFSWRANNIQAYKTLTHQHLGEIVQSITQLQPQQDAIELSFVPWRGDFTRGIFISSTIHADLPVSEVKEMFDSFYNDHPFVVMSEEPIFLKQAVNTNKCVIQLEKVGSKLVVHSIIDNLLKGASGQAVQNMNLMFGLEETSGLRLKAVGF